MALSMNRSLALVYDQEPMFDHRPNSGSSFRENVESSSSPNPFTVTMQTGVNVGKVRWLQSASETHTIPEPYATEHFVSASCGETKSTIALWKLAVVQDEYGQYNCQIDSLDTVTTPSTVTDVVSVSEELFGVTTSKGSLSLYKSPRNDDDTFNRIEHCATKDLHRLRSGPCPARAVATNSSSLVTVGEDGSIHEIGTSNNEVIRSFERADPLSLYCVAFVGRSEIITGNGGGQLKRWDLREADNIPVQIMNPNVGMNNIYGAISLAVHPSQKHLVIAGYQSGCMDLYDLRSGRDPIANLASGDGGSLSELYFHQINPDHFFSCSQTGQVCQWYPGHGSFDMQDKLNYTPDVNIEFLKRGLVFKQLHTSLFPVNSLNVSKHDRLISGGDSGVLFCTEISANN